MNIDLFKKYTKSEIKDLLQFNDTQLKIAIDKKLIVFMDNFMYGAYFFQFLKSNASELESIFNTVK